MAVGNNDRSMSGISSVQIKPTDIRRKDEVQVYLFPIMQCMGYIELHTVQSLFSM